MEAAGTPRLLVRHLHHLGSTNSDARHLDHDSTHFREEKLTVADPADHKVYSPAQISTRGRMCHNNSTNLASTLGQVLFSNQPHSSVRLTALSHHPFRCCGGNLHSQTVVHRSRISNSTPCSILYFAVSSFVVIDVMHHTPVSFAIRSSANSFKAVWLLPPHTHNPSYTFFLVMKDSLLELFPHTARRRKTRGRIRAVRDLFVDAPSSSSSSSVH